MHPGKYCRTYTAKQLEAIAHEQIQTLKKQGLFTVPVDIELIVEKIHGMQIDVQRGLKETHHIWGMIGHCKDTNQFLILIDENLFDLDSLHHVYRMTVAEEFAHGLLLGDAIRAVTSADELQKHHDWHTHDRNAKRLAAALLMPAENVSKDARAYYTELVNITGFGDPNSVKKYLVKQLAERYDVSLASMRFRLNEWPIKIFDKIDQAMKDGLDFLE
ncbi:MAG: ImmA/IrrE family metallo-endopeptidase [Sedimentisphaerales bacterium]|nr:ImmA/IrrE family metallo-endopeptidase [Sedimentisphaerales bacterium]